MSKKIKIVAIIITIFTLLLTVAQPTALAVSGQGDITMQEIVRAGKEAAAQSDGSGGVSSIIEEVNPENGITDKETTSKITKIATTITGALWVASIVIAVCVLVYIGIMYIMGSPSKKSDYKATLTPLVVGIGLVVSATTIINFIFGGFGAK
ncbi:MAG: hypothetical protein J6A89_03475 [Clostridia bacterium]|nr:hypothetical protein [Clostridia bacterium]